MKKMNRKYVAGTAFALGAAVSLTGCFCVPQPHVYGPPEYFERFDKEQEMQEAVYGPPEFFDAEREFQEEVYAPPGYFEIETEVQEDVYGPPEFFEGADGE